MNSADRSVKRTRDCQSTRAGDRVQSQSHSKCNLLSFVLISSLKDHSGACQRYFKSCLNSLLSAQRQKLTRCLDRI